MKKSIPRHIHPNFKQSISSQEYWRTFFLTPTIKLKDIAWELAISFLCDRLSEDEYEELHLDFIFGAYGASTCLDFEISILDKTIYIIDIIDSYIKTGELKTIKGDISTINTFLSYFENIEKEKAKTPLSYDYEKRLATAQGISLELLNIDVVLKTSEALLCLISNADQEYLQENIICEALLRELHAIKSKEEPSQAFAIGPAPTKPPKNTAGSKQDTARKEATAAACQRLFTQLEQDPMLRKKDYTKPTVLHKLKAELGNQFHRTHFNEVLWKQRPQRLRGIKGRVPEE